MLKSKKGLLGLGQWRHLKLRWLNPHPINKIRKARIKMSTLYLQTQLSETVAKSKPDVGTFQLATNRQQNVSIITQPKLVSSSQNALTRKSVCFYIPKPCANLVTTVLA
jgi:hypothetical protein